MRHGPGSAILFALLLFCGACAAPGGSPHGGDDDASPSSALVARQPVEIPLRPYMSRLRAVETTVNGKTLPFLFDTGGGVSLVTPPVARELGCRPAGRVTGYRMSGERIDTELCRSVSLRLGGLELVHETISVFDLMALLPPDWPELGGLVSLKSFDGDAVTLDLAGERLIVETEESLPGRIAGMTPLRMRLGRGVGGAELVPFVAVYTPAGEIWLQLDSGNLDRILLAPHAAEMLGLGVGPPGSYEENAPEDPQGRIELSAVELQVVGLDPVSAPVAVREMIHDGLLNAAFMERFVFTMDFATGRLWATPVAEAR